MIALAMENTGQVDAIYRRAMEPDASDEATPGKGGPGFYAGYFRDLDGINSPSTSRSRVLPKTSPFPGGRLASAQILLFWATRSPAVEVLCAGYFGALSPVHEFDLWVVLSIRASRREKWEN